MAVKAKYIKDLPLKENLEGTDSLILQDDEGTKRSTVEAIGGKIAKEANKRVDELENELAQTNTQLSAKADKSQIGSPLIASSVAEMIDTTKVYVNTSDGYWYSYDGSNWVSGGLYNSQGIPQYIYDELFNYTGLLKDYINLGSSVTVDTELAQDAPFYGYRIAINNKSDIRKAVIKVRSAQPTEVICEILNHNLDVLDTVTRAYDGIEESIEFVFNKQINVVGSDHLYLQVYSKTRLAYCDITSNKNNDLIYTYTEGVRGYFYDGSNWVKMTIAQSDNFSINFTLYKSEEETIKESKIEKLTGEISALEEKLADLSDENSSTIYVSAAEELIDALKTASMKATSENWYTIHLAKGEYNLLPFIDLDRITSVTAIGYRGIEVPEFTKLIGDDNRGSIIKVELPKTASTEQMWTVSPLNLKNSAHLKNLVIVGKNCRYACHDDGGNNAFDRLVENCEFIHYKNEGSVGWAQQDAYGMGLYKGCKVTFKDCDFTAYGYALYIHDNPTYNISSNIRIENCRFEGGDQRPEHSIKFQGMGAKAMTTAIMKNCSVNKDILVENTEPISFEVKKYNTNIEP